MNLLCILFAICAHRPRPLIACPRGRPRLTRSDHPALGGHRTAESPVSESPSGVCYRAYNDTIAEPDVPTIGHGQTRLFDWDGSVLRPVRLGDVLTREEADRQFAVGLRVQYWNPYRDCFTAEALAAQTDAAFTSLTWNIGTDGVCRSTALRRLNAGDIAGGCEALTWWNRAGGRVVRGLTNRRADEYRLCMEGAG
jgi:lysozyme